MLLLEMLGHLKRGYGEDLLAIDGASAYFNERLDRIIRIIYPSCVGWFYRR